MKKIVNVKIGHAWKKIVLVYYKNKIKKHLIRFLNKHNLYKQCNIKVPRYVNLFLFFSRTSTKIIPFYNLIKIAIISLSKVCILTISDNLKPYTLYNQIYIIQPNKKMFIKRRAFVITFFLLYLLWLQRKILFETCENQNDTNLLLN